MNKKTVAFCHLVHLILIYYLIAVKYLVFKYKQSSLGIIVKTNKEFKSGLSVFTVKE